MYSWTDVSTRSKIIKKVGHSDDGNILRIVFHTGSIYDYENVPKSVYNKMIIAQSVGKFYHQLIKGEYASSEIHNMNCYPFSEKNERDFLEGDDDGFFNDLQRDDDEEVKKYIVLYVNKSAKVISENEIIKEMNEAHKNSMKIKIVEIGKTIIDWIN